jgi:hypothetical protein
MNVKLSKVQETFLRSLGVGREVPHQSVVSALRRRGLLHTRPSISGPGIWAQPTQAGRNALRAVDAERKLREARALPPEPPSLAAAARAAGHEPETEEGGRAMMQAITPEHLHRAEAVRKMRTLKPGDEIKYTNYTVGGSYEGTAIVTWDHGKSVEARTLGGERLRLERAQDGSLRRFT